MLIEAIGTFAIIAGILVFAFACAWSYNTLKTETGSVLGLSVIAGAFAFYNLIVKIGNGDAVFHHYVIGLIALAVMALEAWMTYEEYGSKAALARVLSSVYGALALAALALLFFGGGGKKQDNKK